MLSDNGAQTRKSLTLHQQAFMKSEAGVDAKEQLQLMVNNPLYNTRETYSSGPELSTSFVDKHMLYLSEHPKLSVQHYLSNLRLKTKLRS
jgi:hypothetical protein